MNGKHWSSFRSLDYVGEYESINNGYLPNGCPNFQWVRSGLGVEKISDGVFYIGEFKDGLPNGFGLYIDKNKKEFRYGYGCYELDHFSHSIHSFIKNGKNKRNRKVVRFIKNGKNKKCYKNKTAKEIDTSYSCIEEDIDKLLPNNDIFFFKNEEKRLNKKKVESFLNKYRFLYKCIAVDKISIQDIKDIKIKMKLDNNKMNFKKLKKMFFTYLIKSVLYNVKEDIYYDNVYKKLKKDEQSAKKNDIDFILEEFRSKQESNTIDRKISTNVEKFREKFPINSAIYLFTNVLYNVKKGILCKKLEEQSANLDNLNNDIDSISWLKKQCVVNFGDGYKVDLS